MKKQPLHVKPGFDVCQHEREKHTLVISFLFNSLLASNQLRAEAGLPRRHGSLEEAAVANSANSISLRGQRVYLMVQLVSDGALHRPFPFTSNRQPL